MHKNLPNLFIFADHYNNQIFENNKINIGVIYRNYNCTNREKELMKIATICKKKRYQLFVSNDIKLALKSKADGIYIPSFNCNKNFLNLEKKNLTIIGSAHNQKQIYEKTLQKCEAIFLSPAFYVKKSKNFLGIHKFNLLSYSSKVKMMALGGINEYTLRKIKLLHLSGFGGINIFKKKTGLIKAGFSKNKFF
jgi:thiamine monophosphate synthase